MSNIQKMTVHVHFYHLLHAREREKEIFDPADSLARHLLFQKQEKKR